MRNYPLFVCLIIIFASCSQKENPVVRDRLITKHEPYEEFFLQRSFPDESVDITAYEKALHQAKEANLLKDGVGFDSEWTVQGPGNIGARINTIAVHPTDSDIIYVGFARGGVWKTTDGGTNWSSIFDDQLFLAIGDIEIDPQDPNTVYVGTGDPNISGFPFIGDGVYKSTDAGANWTNIGLTNTRITSRILVDPTDSDKLYVGTMGIPFEPTTDKGLYRSLDGGQTWEQSLFVTDTAGIIDIVINPQNPDILYAASWNRIRNNQQSRVFGVDAKIWKTVNGGDTWTVLEGGLPTGELGRIGLTISAQNPDKVYAMYVGTNSHLYGIYRTENGGNSWSEIPTTGEFDFYPNQVDLKDFALAGFGWYFAKIRIDPENDDHIYLCGVELWEAFIFDEDAIWAQASPVWYLYDVHADKHDLVYTPEGDVLLATDGGLYKRDGAQWEDMENIPTSQFYRVAYNPHNPDNYYGGMQDNGTSGGNASNINNWPRIFGGDGFQVVFHPDNPNVMFAETQRGNIVVSTDGGDFFYAATEGIDSLDRKNWDMPYMISHHNPNIMYTGTEKAYIGDFDGNELIWSSISEDLTDGNIFGSASFHSITTLDESHFNPGVLYYGTTDANVWRVVATGGSIQNITAGLPERYVTDIKASPDLPLTVYVTHSGYKDNEFTPRVHRSDDEGNSWIDISGDLPNLAINDIYILPNNQDSILFVATDGGVYGSLNAGENWERMGTNMPYVPVYDLELNVEKNELIAGTFARSIMTYSIDSLLVMTNDTVVVNPPDTTGVAIREVIDTKSKLKIFPSPATNYIQVEFEKSEPGKPYEIVILDASGKLMYQEKGEQEGKVSQRINVNNMAAGTYFVKIKFRHTIRTGSFVKN
jgi:photosystem II stability/assembly factor-like uncharacterized protein